MNQKELIISLIKDDLINTKLVVGLNALGLQANDYSLQLSSTIFELMGFEDNEETELIFERYLSLSKNILEIDTSESRNRLSALALLIYSQLLIQKEFLGKHGDR
ncbi:hypothetical protein ACI6Q2_09520 [Chitinophagaceae bacterium LWZ2-11]